jgi:hypothetical protein
MRTVCFKLFDLGDKDNCLGRRIYVSSLSSITIDRSQLQSIWYLLEYLEACKQEEELDLFHLSLTQITLWLTASSPILVLKTFNYVIYILIYVDDILITGSSASAITNIINSL